MSTLSPIFDLPAPELSDDANIEEAVAPLRDRLEVVLNTRKALLERRSLGHAAQVTNAADYVVGADYAGELSEVGASQGNMRGVFHFDPASYAIADVTTKLNLSVMWAQGNVQTGRTTTIGLCAEPLVAAGNLTVQPFVAGSGVAFVNPGPVDSFHHLESGLFNAPAAGYYAIVANVATGGWTAASSAQITAMLELAYA